MSPSIYQDRPSAAFFGCVIFSPERHLKKKTIINDAEKDDYCWSIPFYRDLARLQREESD